MAESGSYKKLHRRIFLTTLCFALIPLFVAGFGIYFEFVSIYKARVMEGIRTMAENRRNAIDLFLDERISQLNTLVYTQSFEQLKDEDYLNRVFTLLQTRSKSYVDVGIIDREGNHVAYIGPYQLRGLNYSHEENIHLRQKLEEKSGSPGMVGSSLPMLFLRSQIDKVAKTSATVLITGESGTGKELVAQTLHAQSLRSAQQFIPIDCSTIPETIIETELFGHMKGAFTGAIRDKKGLVAEADQGTLFLDEIGDLNPAMQVKLLRLLQEGEYKAVGSNSIRKTDIRFIAATNQNLGEKIKKGEFREDLFYRLNVINIQIPPLRERRDDIPLLVSYFLDKYNKLHARTVKRISNEALQHLLSRNWPGNVRELENIIERGIIMSAGETLEPGDILIVPQASTYPDLTQLPSSSDLFSMPFKEAKDRLIDQFQAEYISLVLTRNEGNVSQAARESGLKRQYLHRLMRETNLDSKAFKKHQTD